MIPNDKLRLDGKGGLRFYNAKSVQPTNLPKSSVQPTNLPKSSVQPTNLPKSSMV